MEDSLKEMQKNFGAKVKLYRTLANLTQEKLAEQTGSATQTISGIESGVGTPSFKKLYKIAKSLNTPLSYLFNKDDEKISNSEKEFIHLELFRKLSDEQKTLVTKLMNCLLKPDDII